MMKIREEGGGGKRDYEYNGVKKVKDVYGK